MCPLRVILIFLSATLAGFFVLRKSFNSSSHSHDDIININNNNNNILERDSPDQSSSIQPISTSIKVRGAIETGFWTCIDMASGRYLWRNLVSSSSSSSSSKRPT